MSDWETCPNSSRRNTYSCGLTAPTQPCRHIPDPVLLRCEILEGPVEMSMSQLTGIDAYALRAIVGGSMYG